MMDIEKLIEQLHIAGAGNPGTIFDEAADALSTLQAENDKLRDELERMKKIMRDNGIMVIPSKYPGGRSEWNIPKPRGQKED